MKKIDEVLIRFSKEKLLTNIPVIIVSKKKQRLGNVNQNKI